MTDRNPNCFRAVRTRLSRVEEELAIACKTLRRNGWTDTADELSRELRLIRGFTKPGGIIDILEKAKDWDDGDEVIGPRYLRDAEGIKPCPDA